LRPCIRVVIEFTRPNPEYRVPSGAPGAGRRPDSRPWVTRDSISAACLGWIRLITATLANRMRLRPVALLLLAAPLAAPLAAQSPRQLTPGDYARAERFLGATTAPLVVGSGVRTTWTEDGRFWYRTTLPGGTAFYIVDPARRSREALFDSSRLAAALAAASGGRVEGSRLAFQSFDLAKDSRSAIVRLQNRRWSCDLQRYSCAPADSSPRAVNAPPASSVSPDGRRAVFIRDNNLWA
jgi:dipeptidyl-peptidase-4